jgi:hypothetical protein
LIREVFSADELGKHICNDEGDSSRILLGKILTPKSIIVTSKEVCYEEDLKAYGPALVTHFVVHEDFEDTTVHRHHGRPVGETKGMHCMVLIGCRTDEASGRKLYLLQNWWESKQFVEVDAEYLEQCGVTVFFVETPQTCIPDVFPTTVATYVEVDSFLDKSEDYAYLEYHVR